MPDAGPIVQAIRRPTRAGWVWVVAFVLLLGWDFARDQRAKPLVFDEALTALLAGSATWDDFGRSLSCGAHHTPPAYFAALRCWMAVAGDSAAAMRLPSLALTAAGALLLAAALRPAFGLWPALLASLAFTASSDMLLANANEARPYAAWWAAQTAWLLVVARCNASGRAGAGALTATAALAFLAPAVQYAAFPFLCASCAALFAHGAVSRHAVSARLALATTLGAVVFTATHLDLALTQQARNVYGSWIPEPSLFLARFLYADGLAVPWELVALAGCGAIVGLLRPTRHRMLPAVFPTPLLFLAAAWLVVPLGLAVVREAGGPNLFYTRYCLPLQTVGAGLAAALAARALRNLAGHGAARWAAVLCATATLARLALNDAAPAYAQRADTAAAHLEPGRHTYTTDPFLATVLAWHTGQRGQVTLLTATREKAERWDALSSLLRARPWQTFRPEPLPAQLAVTQIQPTGFDPDDWAHLGGWRVVRPNRPTPGADIWILDPESPR